MKDSPSRVALVTGGNRGLGLAIVEALVARGLTVVVGSRDAHDGRAAADRVRNGDGAVGWRVLDVTDPASVARAVADTVGEHGRLDVLVNNAAVAIDRGQRASGADFERVRATLDTNLLGAWRCCAAAVPEMQRHGYGRIVNITSALGSMTTMGTGNVSYRVAKAGLNAVTRILADELRGTGVLVNAASPGRINTRLATGETIRTPQDGARTPVWLATLPDDGPTGGLYEDMRPLPW